MLKKMTDGEFSMTKGKLLATASVAALALTFATAASAHPNNFANQGDSVVLIGNLGVGGSGGAGGAGAAAAGGNGGNGSASGPITNTVNSNSNNTYERTEINVDAYNVQNASTGGSIDTSGGSNEQYGGDATASASAGALGINLNGTIANGGVANGDSVDSSIDADTDAHGGTVNTVTTNGDGNATGNASAESDGNSGALTATATGGETNGGDGGTSSNTNTTTGGTATATATGGSTSGSQSANGGAVSSGAIDISGMANAAGAFAITQLTGQFAAGNAANAIAAYVGTINVTPPAGGGM